jgi:multidrug transporter EmrE-like cation transporter
MQLIALIFTGLGFIGSSIGAFLFTDYFHILQALGLGLLFTSWVIWHLK